MPLTEAQRIGRLAELHVERRLTEAGWLCGNFNMLVGNAGSWDLFAKKGGKTRVLRVKGSGTTDVTWSVPDGPSSPFSDFDPDDPCDWTAVVVNVGSDPLAYIFPTAALVDSVYRAGLPADWTILHLHFRQARRDVNHAGQYGYDEVFKDYLENWGL